MLDLCVLDPRSSRSRPGSLPSVANRSSALMSLCNAAAMLLHHLSSLVVQNWIRKVAQMFSLGAALNPGEDLGH